VERTSSGRQHLAWSRPGPIWPLPPSPRPICADLCPIWHLPPPPRHGLARYAASSTSQGAALVEALAGCGSGGGRRCTGCGSGGS
jgi:hypothetical protein